MIDPITQYILEEEQYNMLYEILTEQMPLPQPPEFRLTTASDFGVKKLIGKLSIVNMDKLNATVDKIATNSANRAYKLGSKAGTFKGLTTAAIIAVVIAAAYHGYKRFLSKAAKACKDKI